MNEKLYDPIVAEVRKNREDLLAEFNGDTKKLSAYLKTKRPEMEAAGLRFETAAERQARFAWSQQQEEILERKLASV
ncbi:MAG: hypothetical protein LBC73_03200 [Oscillospiraceae bacterium]|jgi:hypothetical protein|nr:hypothetical protein [Oscillospiraceae bacterium]